MDRGLLTEAGPQGFSMVGGGWPQRIAAQAAIQTIPALAGTPTDIFNVSPVLADLTSDALFALWVWTQPMLIGPGQVGFAFGSLADFISPLGAIDNSWSYPFRVTDPWVWKFFCNRERFVFEILADNDATFYAQSERIR